MTHENTNDETMYTETPIGVFEAGKRSGKRAAMLRFLRKCVTRPGIRAIVFKSDGSHTSAVEYLRKHDTGR